MKRRRSQWTEESPTWLERREAERERERRERERERERERNRQNLKSKVSQKTQKTDTDMDYQTNTSAFTSIKDIEKVKQKKTNQDGLIYKRYPVYSNQIELEI